MSRPYRCKTINPRRRCEEKVRQPHGSILCRFASDYDTVADVELPHSFYRGFNLDPPTESTASSSYADDTPRSGARILNSFAVQSAYQARRKGLNVPDLPSKSKGKGKEKANNGGTIKPSLNSKTNPNAKSTTQPLPKIIPGESLGDYNRRLESHMRPLVSQAIKSAQAKKSAEEKKEWMEKKERREEGKLMRKEAKERREREEQEKEKGENAEAEDEEDEENDKAGPSTTQPGKPVRKPEMPSKRGQKRSLPLADPTDSDETLTATSKHPIKSFSTITSHTRRSVNDLVHAPPTLPSLRRAPASIAASSNLGAFQPTGRTPLNAGQARIMEEERERVIKRYREMKEDKRVEREKEKEREKREAGGGGKKRKVVREDGED